nr:MAG TPA: hypothetical protein [Caudoviricetes sp.]
MVSPDYINYTPHELPKCANIVPKVCHFIQTNVLSRGRYPHTPSKGFSCRDEVYQK